MTQEEIEKLREAMHYGSEAIINITEAYIAIVGKFDGLAVKVKRYIELEEKMDWREATQDEVDEKRKLNRELRGIVI